MSDFKCQSCFWSGTIGTRDEADESRRCVETKEPDHCPVCGKWGLVEE